MVGVGAQNTDITGRGVFVLTSGRHPVETRSAGPTEGGRTSLSAEPIDPGCVPEEP